MDKQDNSAHQRQTFSIKMIRSTVAVIVLSIFSIQLVVGILALPFSNSEPLTIRITLPLIYFTILIPVAHLLLWQIRGRYTITSDHTKVEILKKGGLANRKTILNKKDIQATIKDYEVSTGPLVILQLIGITPPYALKIQHNDKTLSIGCKNIEDAEKLKNMLAMGGSSKSI